MRSAKAIGQLAVALFLAFGVIAFGGLGKADAANRGADIDLHVHSCYQGVGGGDAIFTNCHIPSRAISGATFTVTGVTRATASDGTVAWRPGAGTHTIQGHNISGYAGAYVFCSNQVTGAVLYNGSADTDSVSITTVADQTVVCDWYYIS